MHFEPVSTDCYHSKTRFWKEAAPDFHMEYSDSCDTRGDPYRSYSSRLMGIDQEEVVEDCSWLQSMLKIFRLDPQCTEYHYSCTFFELGVWVLHK